MPVPQLKPVHYNADLPSIGNIKYRPIYVSEEAAILQSIELSDNSEEFFDTMKNLISCATSVENVDKLTIAEFAYLVIMIRMRSKGENINMTVKKCANEECKKSFNFDIKISEAVKFINKDCKMSIAKINNSYTLNISPLLLENYREKKELESDDEYTLYTLKYMIKSINVDGKTYNDFTDEELFDNIISRLTKNEFDKISEALSKLFSLEVSYSYVCPHCKQEFYYKYEDPLDFLF